MNEWAPLESFLEDCDRLGDFMFMYRAHHGEAELFAYKHVHTRRYLFLDEKGNCYRYTGLEHEKFESITPQEALQHAFS